MKKCKRDILQMLDSIGHGDAVVTNGKSGHYRVLLSDGRKFTTSKSPKCQHAAKQLRRDIQSRYPGDS